MDNQLRTLQSLISKSNYKTSQNLADELKISEKTVRNRIKEFNFLVSGNGATIVSKRGAGHKLVVIDEKKYESFLNQKTQRFFKTPEQRVTSLFFELLSTGGYLKLEDLSEKWFISKNTLSNDLKKVETSLNEYNIELLRKPYHGVRVVGSEFNIRSYIADSILFYDFSFFDNEKRVSKMKKISASVHKVIRDQEFTLSEMFLQDLLTHIFVALERIDAGFTMRKDFKADVNLLEKKEIDAANEIADSLEKSVDITLAPQEREYIALHLAGKRTIKSSKMSEQNVVISTKIVKLVSSMLEIVYDTFNIDFRSNLELRLSLSQHLVPLNIRLRYDLSVNNPLLKEIKEKYLYAYTIASCACVPLKEYYKKDISEDEIGYFALLFALEIKRSQRNIPKKKILIVCPSGKGTSQLLMYRFKEEFSNYISEVGVCDVLALENIDFKDYDYIFTTVPINMHIPIPIMEVNQFLDYGEIENVKILLSTADKTVMKKYYTEDLFFTNLEGDTKEEVLENICKNIAEKRDIPKDFYDAVLKRENLISTDLGNLVALPHPYKVVTKDTFVSVSILKKPIVWTNNKVQIVFMVSISKDDNEDLQEFYKTTTNLLLNKKLINKIIDDKSFDTLIKSF